MNNTKRRETYEEAIKINEKYDIAWEKHPIFYKINKKDLKWEEKIDTVFNLIVEIIDE